MKKRLFIIASFLLVVVIALDYYVQSDVFSARLRPYILSPLQEMLGPGARIGLIKVNAVPLYLEVRDVFIPGKTGMDAVQVRKARVYINPFPLLLNRISLPSITLLEPRVRTTRNAAGEISVLQMFERITKTAGDRQKAEPSRFTVHPGTITIRNGSVDFLDRETETAVSISGLTMNVRLKTPVNNIRMSVRDASVRINVKTQPEFSFSLRGGAEYVRDKLTLANLELLASDVSVKVSGTVGTRSDGNLDLTVKGLFGQQTLGRFSALLNKSAIKRERPLMDLMVSVRGKMTQPEVDGAITLYHIATQAFTVQEAGLAFSYKNDQLSLNGKNWRIARARSRMTIDGVAAVLDRRASGFDIKKLEILSGDLVARASGRIDMAKGYDLALRVESSGRSRTLSFLTGVTLEGKATLTGALTGELFSPEFDGSLSAGPITIKDILFHDVAGSVQFRESILSFSQVDIHQLGSRYILDGSIDFSHENVFYTAYLNVVRSDVVSVVALFYKPLPLLLSTTGVISFAGSGSDFAGSAALILGPGSAYGESFSKGSITIALSPERVSFPQVILQKGGGEVAGSGWIGFNGTYSAQLTGKAVNLSEVDHLSGIPLSGTFELEVNSSGPFSAPQLKALVTFDELRYYQVSLGPCEARLTIDAGKLVFESDLIGKNIRLAGSMNLSSYVWNAGVFMQAANLTPFLVSDGNETLSRMKLIADGKMTVRGKGASVPALTGSAVFQQVSLSIGDYRLENDGAAVLGMDDGKFIVKALTFTGAGTHLAVTGSSRIMKDYDLVFAGETNLSLLRLLYPEIEHSDGKAVLNLTIRGPWDEPELAGAMRLENGELKIKEIPQTFSALNGAMELNRDRVVIDSLTGDVGGGGMRLSGWVQLAHYLPEEFSTRVVFDNVTVRYPPGLVSTLSGELYYDGKASEQNLSGDVLMKRALYDKRVEWKSMLLETFRGFSQKRNMEIGWIGETQLNIRFHGKDNILIQNNLAKIPLEVDMFIRGTPDQPQLLGRLEARTGVAYFRRNDFKILHASVDFVDPNRINPVLDIQAETRVREYTIRLAISGAADRSVVTFISDPPLSEMDVLSMLALGKTSADLKGKGAEVGMGEAASFATGQFQDIFERRARSLTGLDRFQVDPYLSKDASVPRVTVGKELVQDKLYFTYSSNVGTSTPDTVLRVEYVLDKHFSLVGEQNELGTIGGDVKFRFEFK